MERVDNGKLPEISVIMPAYKAEKYLAEAIESVLSQTFADFELLVVFDPGGDDTEEIVRRYASRDGRVRLVRNVHGPGIVGALNTGLEQAGGRFIARADADDINRPDRFRIQLDFLRRHPDIYIIGTGYAPFDEFGHRFDAHHPPSCIEIVWHHVCTARFAHPTVMFRREVYDQIGGYPDTVAEDFAYFSDVVKKFKSANLRPVLLDYRETLVNRSKVMAREGEDSVKRKSLENFRHYLPDSDKGELFFRYQYGHELRLSQLPEIVSINRKLLKKMIDIHGVPLFGPDMMRLRVVILLGYMRKLCMTYLKADPKRLLSAPRKISRMIRRKTTNP